MLEALVRPGNIGAALFLVACVAINLGMILQKLATVKSGIIGKGFWAACGFSMDYLTSGYLWLGLALYTLGQYGCLHALALAPHFTSASLNAIIILSNSLLAPLVLGEKHRGWSMQCTWLMAAGSTAVLMADGSTLIMLLVDDGSTPYAVKEHVWQKESQLESHFAQRPFLALIAVIFIVVLAAAFLKILSITSSRVDWARHRIVDLLVHAIPAAMLASLALLFVRSVVHLALTSIAHPESIWLLTRPQWGILATLWFLPVYYSMAAVLQTVVAGVYFEEFHHLGMWSMVSIGIGVVLNIIAVWILLRSVDQDDVVSSQTHHRLERSRICPRERLPQLYTEDDDAQWLPSKDPSSLTGSYQCTSGRSVTAAASLFKLAGLRLSELSPDSSLRLARNRDLSAPYMVGNEEVDSSIWSWSGAPSEAASIHGEQSDNTSDVSTKRWKKQGKDETVIHTSTGSVVTPAVSECLGGSPRATAVPAAAGAAKASRWGIPFRFLRMREINRTATNGEVVGSSSEKSPCRAA
ncbi:hypothetical protein FOL47_003619 [Perkinsus chesapeaki]|uniref:NIPA-like protein 3 n=1 Tax=Perkinsus chesapeaki TaxID=330153 RepID=A0A7J6M6X5_PERCH|nr:hypothetical protein FOL47_003619 [Perkinsus chesapeaki]